MLTRDNNDDTFGCFDKTEYIDYLKTSVVWGRLVGFFIGSTLQTVIDVASHVQYNDYDCSVFGK